jgi:hypothetical protein
LEKKARSIRRGVLSAAGSKTKEEIVLLNIIIDYEISQELSFTKRISALGGFLDIPGGFSTDRT